MRPLGKVLALDRFVSPGAPSHAQQPPHESSEGAVQHLLWASFLALLWPLTSLLMRELSGLCTRRSPAGRELLFLHIFIAHPYTAAVLKVRSRGQQQRLTWSLLERQSLGLHPRPAGQKPWGCWWPGKRPLALTHPVKLGNIVFLHLYTHAHVYTRTSLPFVTVGAPAGSITLAPAQSSGPRGPRGPLGSTGPHCGPASKPAISDRQPLGTFPH